MSLQVYQKKIFTTKNMFLEIKFPLELESSADTNTGR